MTQVPESIIWYRNRANSAALERIANEKKPPEELTLSECQDFYLAKLTDLRVHTDYWCMMHDLWTEIWEEVLASHDMARLEDFDDDDDPHLLDEVWEERVMNNWHVIERDERWIYTAVAAGLEINAEITLHFSIPDDNGLTGRFAKAKAPPGWHLEKEKDDDWIYWKTDAKLCLIPEKGEIDTSRLKDLARKAVDATKSIREK